MSVTVEPKLFQATLARAVGAVRPEKSSYPILHCVKIGARGGAMRIVATDLDVEFSDELPATGEIADLCVEAVRLKAIVDRLKGRSEILIRTAGAGEAIEIESGRSRFTLPTMSPESWPTLTAPRLDWEFAIEGKVLARLFTALRPAVSTEQTRYYLCGVCLSAGSVLKPDAKDSLVAVATNGHKAYARSVAIEDMPALPPIIVPSFTCDVLAKLIDSTDEVTVRAGETRIEVERGGMRLVSKLIEGTFPDWRRVFPKVEPQVSYDAKSLITAVETASAATNTGKNGKGLKLTFGESETELTARDVNNAGVSGQDSVEHSKLGGKLIDEIGINADYLSEMVEVLDVETVEIGMVDAGAPVRLSGAGHSDRIIVIMPMRV